MTRELEIRQVVKKYQKMLQKMKADSGLDLLWQDMRYCVLEFFHVVEGDVDQIIARRYARGNDAVGMDIKVVFLSKLDFSRKISILDEIQEETAVKLPVNQIRVINNLRNAFIHNYPRGHKNFLYKKGHIYADLKIKDFLADMEQLLKELSICMEKVKPVRDKATSPI